MGAGFDRNETGRQSCKFATENRSSCGQRPAGDDLRLIVQNAEMASSVTKINADGHPTRRLLFPKIAQRSNIRAFLHSSVSCSCTLRVQVNGAAYCNRCSPPFSFHLDKSRWRRGSSL